MATIKGEYWIIDGRAHYCDGDIGEYNHEGYALDHLRRLVMDSVNLELGEWYDWDDELEKIPESLCDALGLSFDPENEMGSREIQELIVKHAADLQLDPRGVAVAFESAGTDARNYMAEKYGWIILQNDHVGTHHLTADALDNIREGIADALDQEGWFGGEEQEDFEISIYVAATSKTYCVKWSELDSDERAGLLQEALPLVGPNAQVAQMDKELQHPYYNQ